MRTIVDDAVLNQVDEYAAAISEMVSRERAHTKVENMVSFLYSIGDLMGHRVCMDRALGQRFDSEGNPKFKNLKRINYQDESRFQWAIAYIVDEQHDVVRIVKMIPGILCY